LFPRLAARADQDGKRPNTANPVHMTATRHRRYRELDLNVTAEKNPEFMLADAA